MDVDVGDMEESSVPVKAGVTPAKRTSPTKPASKSKSTPTAKSKPAPQAHVKRCNFGN